MRSYSILLLLLLVHLIILTQIQFTAWPEMLSYPYLLNHGFKLYKDIALPYQPVLIVLLTAYYNFLGYTVFNLQIITWAIILLNDVLIFLIVKKVLNNNSALISVLFYLLFQPFTDGNMLWFDLAATPFILGGLVVFLYLNDFRKYLFLGFLLSLAALVKQQVALVGIFALFFVIFSTKNRKNILYYIIGGLIPVLVVLLYVLYNGIVNEYIFWTFHVPLVWYPKSQGYVHLPSGGEWVKTLLIFSPVIISLIYYKKWTPVNLLLSLLFVAAFITSFPRFEFFRLQPTIALAILPLAFLINWLNKYKYLILIIPAVYLLISMPSQIVKGGDIRFFSKEDFKISDLIKSKAANESKIYLLGFPSSLYIYTDKLTFKPWVDNYNWYMEIPGIQQKVIKGLENEKIDYIFRKIPQKSQWFDLGSYQPKQIVGYIEENYSLSETIDDIQIWRRKD